LIDPFRLAPAQRAGSLSKAQQTQVALIAAVSPETDLLVLGEPTSGLDPIVRREFIEGPFSDGVQGAVCRLAIKVAGFLPRLCYRVRFRELLE